MHLNFSTSGMGESDSYTKIPCVSDSVHSVNSFSTIPFNLVNKWKCTQKILTKVARDIHNHTNTNIEVSVIHIVNNFRTNKTRSYSITFIKTKSIFKQRTIKQKESSLPLITYLPSRNGVLFLIKDLTYITQYYVHPSCLQSGRI